MMIIRPFGPLLALAALSALPILSAHADQLALQSGDAVTVSGAGTIGVINGLPVSNNTSSYSNGTGAVNFYAVDTAGTSTFTLGAGGSLSGTDLQSGTGNVGYALDAEGSGIDTITGGTITGGGGGVLAHGTGPVIISGGVITTAKNGNGSVIAQGSGVVTVTGGTITNATGGQFLSLGLLADSNGTINLFSQGGAPFLVDGVSKNNTALTFYTAGTDTISATLLNGNVLNTTFEVFSGGTINLNVGNPPVPEPSQLLLLGLGALGLARRRRGL